MNIEKEVSLTLKMSDWDKIWDDDTVQAEIVKGK